jgi:hypothetical protein
VTRDWERHQDVTSFCGMAGRRKEFAREVDGKKQRLFVNEN